MKIISIRTEDINEATRAALIDVCVQAHQEEDFRKLFSYFPSGLHFIAYHEGEPVSHAVITTRWLQPHGHPLLKTAYVDAVSTHPAYQGKGYGSTVMRQLADEIKKEYVIACLETERMSFYERLGWQVWRGPLAGRGDDGLVLTPEQKGIMILQLPETPVLDLDSELTIECQPDRIW